MSVLYLLYKQDYLQLGFIENESNKAEPKCVLCDNTLSNVAMKPSPLKDHIEHVHSDHAHKDEAFFRKRRDERLKQR